MLHIIDEFGLVGRVYIYIYIYIYIYTLGARYPEEPVEAKLL